MKLVCCSGRIRTEELMRNYFPHLFARNIPFKVQSMLEGEVSATGGQEILMEWKMVYCVNLCRICSAPISLSETEKAFIVNSTALPT